MLGSTRAACRCLTEIKTLRFGAPDDVVIAPQELIVLELIINADVMDESASAIRLGLAVAGRLANFVIGLHVVPMYSSVMAIPEALACQDADEQAALLHHAWWKGLCEGAGVQGAWEVIRGLYVPVLAKRSRLADLVITQWPLAAPEAPVGLDDVTRALFSKAAPLLLVPDRWQHAEIPRHVLIAWNGSAEATRAVKAALPLLRAACSVRVLNGEREGLAGLTPPSLPLREWLVRHGVNAQWHPFDTRVDIGRQLLEQAAAMECDLLVMGAWGRSRISELVLGGATRHVLEKAQIPVLMAH
jgi:nucleotide-binding universal stress UspA family protein